MSHNFNTDWEWFDYVVFILGVEVCFIFINLLSL